MCKKILFIISFLVVFGFIFNFGALNAKAMTTAEIQALIQQLQQQIVQLQQQLAEAQEEPAAWCHDFNVKLRIGDTGEEVVALQTALTKDGATSWENKGYDGVFDEITASEVVGFQEKYKEDILAPWGLIHGTGYVGRTTLAKLNKLYGCEEEEEKEVLCKDHFKMAFILVAQDKSELTAERINKLKQIKNYFSNDFHIATQNLGYMDTSYPIITMVNDGFLISSDQNYVKVIESAVTKRFYESNPDEFDFISIYTTFDTPSYQHHGTVKNNIDGIGQAIFDNSSLYGSNGKLIGVNFMKDIDMYKNPNPDSFRSSGLLHETGHQWCCYVGDNYGIPNSDLPILQSSIHWHCISQLHDFNTSQRDPMGGCNWVDNGDGTFTRKDVIPKVPIYHNLTLYLMGLIPKEQVPDVKLILPEQEPSYYWQWYEPLKASVKYISVNNIISRYGTRRCTPEETEEKTITVTSPNGGEILNEGDEYTIRWKSENLPTNAIVYITLFRSDGTNASPAIVDISDNIPASQNYYKWKVALKDLDWAFGYLEKFKRVYATLINNYQYRIFIGVDCSGEVCDISAIKDTSDNYFSIVEAIDDIDGIAPTSNITSPPNGSLQATDFSVSVIDSDEGDSGLNVCYYHVVDIVTGKWGVSHGTRLCNSSFTVTVGEGKNCQSTGKNACLVYAFAKDGAGNVGKYDYRYFDIGEAKKIPPCGSYGDVNSDGYITHADVIATENCIISPDQCTSDQKLWSDVNRDGEVNNLDVTRIEQLLYGEISVFFPICAQPNLSQGWNSFSSALKEGIFVKEIEKHCGNTTIYRWNADDKYYEREYTKLESGIGYYVAVDNSCTLLHIPGNSYALEPISLSTGKFYFIGGPYNPRKVADILGTCNLDKLIVQTKEYGTSENIDVGTLEPWKAYLIKSELDCVFVSGITEE